MSSAAAPRRRRGGAAPRRTPALAVTVLLGLAGLLAGAFGALYPSASLQLVAGPAPAGGATPPLGGTDDDARAAGDAGRPGHRAASAPDELHLRFSRPPRAGVVFDLDSRRVLYKRAQARMPIASLTKIMTALLVVDSTRSDERAASPRRRSTTPARGRPPQGQQGAGRGPAPRHDAALGQRRGQGAGHPRRRQRAALRADDEPACAGPRPELHALRLAARAGVRQPLVRRRPRGHVAPGHGRAAHRPRAPQARRRRRFPVKGGRLFVYSTNPLLRPWVGAGPSG